MELNDFRPGQRVQLHPATDAWMRGDRFGTVVSVGCVKVTLKLDSGHKMLTHPRNILEVVS
jgi:hypothetical protein